MTYREYIFNGKPTYVGMVKCKLCGEEFNLDTTDKDKFTNNTAICFKCFMERTN